MTDALIVPVLVVLFGALMVALALANRSEP